MRKLRFRTSGEEGALRASPVEGGGAPAEAEADGAGGGGADFEPPMNRVQTTRKTAKTDRTRARIFWRLEKVLPFFVRKGAWGGAWPP